MKVKFYLYGDHKNKGRDTLLTTHIPELFEKESLLFIPDVGEEFALDDEQGTFKVSRRFFNYWQNQVQIYAFRI